MNYLWRDINYHVILRQGWGGGIGDCEINIVAKRINPPDQQQIIIKHAYEKMLFKTFSFGTQIRTFTNRNDFLQNKTYSGSFRCHSGVIPVHSGVIPVHSGPFRCHSGSFRFIPVHSGPFRLIPVHSAPFRCLVTPQLRELLKILHDEKEQRQSWRHFRQHCTSMASGTFTSRSIAAFLFLSGCFLPLTSIRVVVRHSNVL